MVKACLFDLDGVVFNTEPLYTLFWRNLDKRLRPNIDNFEHIIKGQTLAQIYDKYFAGEEKKQEEITAFVNEYEQNMSFNYITGFEDFVKDVRSKGIKTAVVTSSNLEKMQNVYNKHPEFKGYFDEILTSEDFEESKPSPDCYFKAAARFGVSPKECIVFEDSFNGLRSGIASGARVIGLATTNSMAEIEPYTKEVISNYDGFTLSDH
ncbi:HAD family phosphatase [Prevotella melaninogenica]|uniref:HAD family hydrolase n=1 Tax=Prevotella melaninogenica TaxID=28132 RepID=UPI001C5F7BF4|nr:HAD family phosphatase [Prevotella melaninogenica]MBW4740408.1 HAD family phosphatase [Prevotella melaninogenica]MBW4911973.1 HAD family phosphatase [Prevotella melaninogenica]